MSPGALLMRTWLLTSGGSAPVAQLVRRFPFESAANCSALAELISRGAVFVGKDRMVRLAEVEQGPAIVVVLGRERPGVLSTFALGAYLRLDEATVASARERGAVVLLELGRREAADWPVRFRGEHVVKVTLNVER